MNITANNVASKLFVAFVASAMLFTLATPAKAATAEELQAQIDALMAQIAALKGDTATTPKAGCTFTRPLTLGSEGADVKCLQDAMTPTYFTNAGGSTGYFGPVTKAAVAAWQTANGVMPAAGYFGPVSQAKFAAMAPTTPDTDDSDDEDATSGDLSGEADLSNFELDSAEDDEIEEGAEEAEVAEITVEFENGDAMITRLDVAFTATSEEDVWKTLEEVQLMVDGDVVATKSADSKSDYLGDEDDGVLRFSGLDIVAMEDEEVVITVAATLASSIDDLPATWTVDVKSMRFIDGDDVTTTETDASSNTMDVDEVTFTLSEAGGDDEIIVKTSSQDPDGTTLQVNDDKKSDWYTVFAFDLDTDDSVNDISLNEVAVDLVFATGKGYALLVDDVELVIDGTTIDDVDVDVATTGSTTPILTFDVDGDVVIDAGDRVTAELKVRFKSLAAANEGATIQGKILDADLIEGEGADDLGNGQTSGSATGDVHTLRTSGISVELGDTSAVVTTGDSTLDDYATFEVELEVTAFEQDVFISTDPATSIVYAITDGAGATLSGFAASSTVVLTSTGEENGGYFEVNEGETETVTISVTFKPGIANTAARLQLTSVEFDEDASSPDQSWSATPATTYRTATKTIVN